MPYRKIPRDVKLVAIRLYERDLLTLHDILDRLFHDACNSLLCYTIAHILPHYHYCTLLSRK